jgi:TRAP-type C4-dicarboxylate transport system permease small subunit
MRIFRKAVESIETFTFVAVALAIIISMFAGTFDVIGIRFFRRSLRGSVEFSTVLMPIIVFVGLAYIQRKRLHIRVEFFYARASARGRAAMDILNGVIVILASAVLTWIAWQGAQRSLRIREAAQSIAFPIYPVKFAIAFGTALMILRMIVDTVEAVDRFRHPESAPPPDLTVPLE